MSSRRRARVKSAGAVGGGGGGPAPSGLFSAGPEYGQNAKGVDPDGITHRAAVSRALDSVDMTAESATVVSRALDSVEMTADPVAVVSRAIDSVEMTADPSVSVSRVGRLVVVGMRPDDDTSLLDGSGVQFPTSVHASRTPDAVGNNEQRTYIAWDLTDVQGTVEAAAIRINIGTTNAANENAPYAIFTNATRPFDESTATWAADEPPPGTNRQAGTVVATTGGRTTQTITLNAGPRGNAPGNWLYLRILGAAALGLFRIDTEAWLSAGITPNGPELDLTVRLTT